MKNTFKTMPIIAILAIFALGIVSCASFQIESVEWDTLKGPAKVRQYYSISTTDVSVYANYKNGNRREVMMFTTSHDRDATGIQTVTVTISGQGTGTFQTEVMELTGIRIENPPSKITYAVGERADLAGIRVMGSWRDLPDAEIPASQITVTSFDTRTAGTDRLVTIDYKGKTATFPATVVVANPFPGTYRLTFTEGDVTSDTTMVINANGTGNLKAKITSTAIDLGFDMDTDFTYTYSGNTLTYKLKFADGTESDPVRATLSGNRLTIQGDTPLTLTRQ